MKRVLLLLATLAAGAASAQTYQVGQYLGNLNEAGRFAWGTMGGATSNLPHSSPATWSALAPGVLRHSAQASATIGGRTVPLTLLSRVPVAGMANAARAVSLANPATAAVTLLGFAAMQGWLTPAGLEWNTDPATNKDKPFLGDEYGGEVVWCMTGTTTCTAGSGAVATYSYWLSLQQRGICGRTGGVLPPTFYKVSETADTETWNFTTEHCSEPWRGQIPNGPDALGPRSVSKQTQATVQRVPMTWEQAEPHLSGTGIGSGKDFSAVDWKSVAEGLLQRGASLPQPVDQTVSGPAQQLGQKTTKQNADGTTTTTQTVNNYNYAGNTVTVTTTTNSTVTNNAGDTISEETETTEDAEEQAATDSALPGMPELYERKYPNGLKGVWDEKIAVIKTSSLFGMVPGLTPNLGDGGCPVWTIPVDIGLIDFGTYDVSIPCSVWAFVRVVIILTAMFLARRLMFGG